MLNDLAGLPRGFWLISIVAIVQMMSSTAYQPLVPQLALSIGVSNSMLGTLFSLAGLLPVFVALPIGALIDRLGIKKVLVWGTITRSSASLFLWLCPSFATLLVSLTMSSASFLLTEVGQQAYIASLGTGRDTERNFGWFAFVMGIGMVLGPIASGMIRDTFGFGIAFLVAGGISALSLFVIAMLSEAKPASRRPAISLSQLFSSCKPVLANVGVLSAILIVVFLYFNLGAWEIYLPALMTRKNFSSTQIGLVVSTFTLATMLARPALSLGTDFWGRHGLTVLSLGIGALGLTSVPVLNSVPLLVLAAIACGIGRGLVPLLSLVTISDQTGIEERGLALSMRMMAIRMQSVVHPLVFGAVAGGRGIPAVFYLAGALAALSSAWVFFSRVTRRGLVRAECLADSTAE